MSDPQPALSVVIPCRDEARNLPALLADLAAATTPSREVVVVDGGSRDGTPRLAALAGATVLHRAPCRGGQLRAGIAASGGAWLLLLHADVRLPPAWGAAVASAMKRGADSAWCFDLRIAGPGPALRLVEAGVALRSRWGQRPYGDQGLLLSRALHDACGGIAPLPLMEDLEFVERLRRRVRIGALGLPLRVDDRRWRRHGVWRTTLTNVRLRRAWRRGASAAELAALYYGGLRGQAGERA